MNFSPKFIALNREASLAQELVCTGVLALKKANAAETGLYFKAFFNLSNGMERMGKLILILDYMLENNGSFPSDKELRAIGHDLSTLFECARKTRKKHAFSNFAVFPNDQTSKAVIECLADFAKGSRYYNLDFVTQSKALGKSAGDPITMWRARVGAPILEQHYSEKRRAKDKALAQEQGSALDQFSYTLHTSETGSLITSQVDRLILAAETKVIQRWAPFYCLRLIRFLAKVIMDLHNECFSRGIANIPWMSEHFGKFYNEDDYLKRGSIC